MGTAAQGLGRAFALHRCTWPPGVAVNCLPGTCGPGWDRVTRGRAEAGGGTEDPEEESEVVSVGSTLPRVCLPVFLWRVEMGGVSRETPGAEEG